MTRRAEAERRRIAPARTAAYEVLRAVNSGAADLPHALARARDRLHDDRDRALAGEIATGTLRWQGAFDHIISMFAKRPIARFDAEVVDILRSAMFQLLHLDRVPASAAVNDAVQLTRLAGKTSAAPLVNALLRRVSRERGRLPLPARPADLSDRSAVLDYLSIALSHPRWLVARWLDRYGFEATESWLRFNNVPAPLTLRVNRLKTNGDALLEALAKNGVRAERGRYAADALVIVDGNPLLTPLADEGLFFVQDEASQLVAAMVAAREGDRVLDACASPGGKTTAIAAAMHDRGLIVATDVRGRRVDLLARTVEASGASCIRVVQADAGALPFDHAALDGSANGFDWILLDAPCSGLGTIRRDPDLRWRRSEEDFARLSAMQLAMLRETARVLRPGGRLVYSTCSSEPEENEDVVAAFLADGPVGVRPQFVGGRPQDVAETARAVVSPQLVNAAGHLRTYPFRDGLEAFFAAILVKAG
ncbi:MAG TPA: 16S rRNA (cytosine(967)-C(5))-methyltransferase RsmB [Vicinamibacterales bacterium]|nr:16S rRNA (cytosine(967)-C(5))-methyltransferase RsmB [Vicinamibacterales bacterium]